MRTGKSSKFYYIVKKSQQSLLLRLLHEVTGHVAEFIGPIYTTTTQKDIDFDLERLKSYCWFRKAEIVTMPRLSSRRSETSDMEIDGIG